jgi:hypothetical protein
MIIHDFNVQRVAVLPAEAYTPLVIHTDAELAFAIPAQFFEAIAMGQAKVIQCSRVVQKQQLPPGRFLNLRRKPPRCFIIKNALGFLAAEAAYH